MYQMRPSPFWRSFRRATNPLNANQGVRDLLNALAEVADKLGVLDEKPKDSVRLRFGPTMILVGIELGRLWCRRATNVKDVLFVPLDFNPITEKWESIEVDETIAPTPGESFPRKDPLVVLVETVERALELPVTGG